MDDLIGSMSTLALRSKDKTDADKIKESDKLAYQYTMEQFAWSDFSAEVRLRARIGVDIDMSSADFFGTIKGLDTESTSNKLHDLLDDSEMARIVQYNLRRSGAWEVAASSPIIGMLLNEKNVTRHFLNCTDSLQNQWGIAVSLVLFTMLKLKDKDLDDAAIRKPQAVVYVSTRSQAVMLYDKVLNLCYGTDIMPRVLYGTYSPRDECLSYTEQLKNILEKSCDILIGPPGRFIHVLEKHYRQDGIGMLCLDQAQHFLRNNDTHDFFERLRGLRLVRQTSTLLIQGSAFNKSMATTIATQLDIPRGVWSWAGHEDRELGQIAESVQQKFVSIEDGTSVLREAGQRVSKLLCRGKKVLVVATSIRSAEAFHKDLVILLQAAGMSHPGEKIGLFNSDMTQLGNERVIQQYMFGRKLKAVVGTQMLVDIPDFDVTDAIIWIGLPRYGLDYRNGLMRVYRSGTTKSGLSHAFITESDGWDMKEIATVIVEGGKKTLEEALEMLRKRPKRVSETSSAISSVHMYNIKRRGSTCNTCDRYGHWSIDCHKFP